MAASYDPATSVTLAFDRAIDVGGLNPSAVVVYDGPDGYCGGGGTLVAADTVRVDLLPTGEVPSAVVVLNAPPSTGIVAIDDGGTWDGVSFLPLPYP